MLDDAHFFTVTDLKQFTYCARVVYYERCLPHIRPRTFKMDAGAEAHEREQRRAVRRTTAQYDGVPDGVRRFNVRLISPALQLSGELDEVVYASTGDVFPVDYKLAKHTSPHYKVQLAAYGLMLEEAEGTPVEHGFLYLIPKRETVEIVFTPALRRKVQRILADLQEMVEHETMPPAASKVSHCAACEFRRFCNDVS